MWGKLHGGGGGGWAGGREGQHYSRAQAGHDLNVTLEGGETRGLVDGEVAGGQAAHDRVYSRHKSTQHNIHSHSLKHMHTPARAHVTSRRHRGTTAGGGG
jgi:hypothetical protein